MNLSVLLWGIPQAMRAAARLYAVYAARLKQRNLVAQFRLRDRPEGRWIQLENGRIRSRKGVHGRADLTIHFKNKAIAESFPSRRRSTCSSASTPPRCSRSASTDRTSSPSGSWPPWRGWKP